MIGKLAAALALAALVWTAGCVPEYPHGLPETPTSSELNKSLAKAYHQHPVRFRLRHEGDEVQARGTVYSIPRGRDRDLQNGSGLAKPTCRFSELEEVASLDKGDEITYSGIVSVSDGRPVLTGCRVTGQR